MLLLLAISSCGLQFFSAGAPEVGNRKFKKSLLSRRHEAPPKERKDTPDP